MVFVAAPSQAGLERVEHQARHWGHSNNTSLPRHGRQPASLAAFSIRGHDDIEDRLKEFTALVSFTFKGWAAGGAREDIRNRESVYILLQIVQVSPFSPWTCWSPASLLPAEELPHICFRESNPSY